MPRPTCCLLLAVVASGCHSYAPEPVDLTAHARAFAARLPDPATMRAQREAGDAPVDERAQVVLDDGIDLREGRLVATMFHPDCRLARRRAFVRAAERDHAGQWTDPRLGADFARILETVPYQWVAAASLEFTLPLSGRLGLERQLAWTRHEAALAEALATEASVQNRIEGAFARWSANRRRCDLLRDLGGRLRELEATAQQLATAEVLTQQEARVFSLERLRRDGELALAEANDAAGVLELKRLLGLHPDAPVQFVPATNVPLHVQAPAERPDRLLVSPRLTATRVAHQVAERELELAVRKQWPDLVLSPGWQEEDGQPRAALGFSLPIPLFAGNDAEIARAEAHRAEAAEALRAAYEGVVQELAGAELRLAAAQRQRQLVLTQLLPLAERQVADGRRLAELGELQPLLLLDSLVRAHDANAMVVDTALAEAEATVAMNALFWDDPTPPPSERRTP